MCHEQSRRSLPCPPGTEGRGWKGWAGGWPGLPGRRSGGQSLLRWTFSVASAWPPSGVGGWPLGGRGKPEPSPHRGQWKEKPGSDSAAHPPPPAPSPPSRAPAGPVAHGLVTLQAADGLGAAQAAWPRPGAPGPPPPPCVGGPGAQGGRAEPGARKHLPPGGEGGSLLGHSGRSPQGLL